MSNATAMADGTNLPSFGYEVTVALLDGRKLPDGDEIVLTDLGSNGSPGHIDFELSVASKGMWWKGIVLFEKDKSNAWKEIVEGDGKELPKSGRIAAGLLKTHYFVLSKAKGLGIHRNVYNVSDADEVLRAGKKYGVMWNRD